LIRPLTATRRPRGLLWPCATFVSTLGLFGVAYYRDPATGWLLAMTRMRAEWAGAALNVLGHSTRVVFQPQAADHLEGYWLYGERASLGIAVDCNGVWAFVIFAAAVLAIPSSWRAKAWGLGLGVPLLWIVNLIRIVSLYYVAIHLPSVFEALHLYFWQFLIIGIAFVLLAAWAEYFAALPRPASYPRA
jgi:exosortase/archaeosortase family protein